MRVIAPMSSMAIHLSFTNHFAGKLACLSLGADGKPLPPTEQRAQIKRPLELTQTAVWLLAQRSPGNARRWQNPSPSLRCTFGEYTSISRVRFLFGCAVNICQRMVVAPAGQHLNGRTTWAWTWSVLHRVARGHVTRVQVRRHMLV